MKILVLLQLYIDDVDDYDYDDDDDDDDDDAISSTLLQ